MEICIFCMGGVEERQLFFFCCFESIYVLFGQSVADTTAPPAIRKLSMRCLAAEAVQGAALALERVDDIHGGDGLPACVLGVGDGIADDSLKEDLEDATGLLVDEAGDALDTTTASETADGGLGDALDVVTQHLSVALSSALSESLSSLSTSRHVYLCE